MKRLFPLLAIAVSACGPEAPTPASPSAEATKQSSPRGAAPPPASGDRASKTRKTFTTMMERANAHDATRVREIYALDAVKGVAGPDGWRELKGVDAIERQSAALSQSAPDLAWRSVRVFQGSDFIASEYVVVGTNPATRKRAGVRGIMLLWFDDEAKIKKEHVYIDQLTMLVQTGRKDGNAPEPVALPTGDPSWIVAKNDATEEANVATFKATWPDKALLSRSFEHEDIASGVVTREAPAAAFAPDRAWGFGDFVVAEMQMKAADGVAKHVVEIVELRQGQIVHARLYWNLLEGKGL